MPKNKGKGGKNRRRGKNENESEKRELIFKEDEQEYAQVIKMLGNGRLEAMCFDGQKRLCHIRGKMRKKVSTAKLQWCTLDEAFIFFLSLNSRSNALCASISIEYMGDTVKQSNRPMFVAFNWRMRSHLHAFICVQRQPRVAVWVIANSNDRLLLLCAFVLCFDHT